MVDLFMHQVEAVIHFEDDTEELQQWDQQVIFSQFLLGVSEDLRINVLLNLFFLPFFFLSIIFCSSFKLGWGVRVGAVVHLYKSNLGVMIFDIKLNHFPASSWKEESRAGLSKG